MKRESKEPFDRGQVIHGYNLNGLRYENKHFNWVRFGGADLVNVRFVGCVFNNVSFNGASLVNVTFENCTFEDCLADDVALMHNVKGLLCQVLA